jgi:LysM repeat protein
LALNHLQKGQEPVAGSVLNLQTTTDKTPDTYNTTPANTANNNARKATVTNDAAFVPAGKKEVKTPAVEMNEEEGTSEPVASQNVVATAAPVNIANEPAVEDEVATTVPAKKQAATKDEKKMSALDKLKAHMDQAVYSDNDYKPKATGDYSAANKKGAIAKQADDADNDTEAVTAKPAKKEKKHAEAEKPAKKIIPKASKKSKVHIVKKGESLFEIAEDNDLTVKELQKLNKMKTKTIQPGMKLKVK